MQKIWIIAQIQSETYGHGSFGMSFKLPTTGPYDSGPFHPCFSEKEKAIAYIKALPNPYGLEAVAVDWKG